MNCRMSNSKNMRNTFVTIYFICSLVFVFSQQAMIFDMNYLIQYVATYPWIILGIIFYFSNEVNIDRKIIIKKLLQYFTLPWIFITAVTICSYVFKMSPTNYLLTSIINLVNIFTVYAFAASSFLLFGKKLLKYIFLTFIIVYIIAFIKGAILTSVNQIITTLAFILLGNDPVNNVFEVGDITFASGILVILMLWNIFVNKKINIIYLFLSIFFVLIGVKRIQIVSLIIISAWLFLIRKKTINVTYKITSVISVVFIGASLLFVYLISTGELFRLLWEYGIDTMGRTKMWEYASQYMEFNLQYFGRGYGYTLRKLSEGYFAYVLHSDVLRLYIELGFIPFILWEYMQFFYIKRKIKKDFSVNVALFYFILLCYLFILHFTDNTTNYFVTQFTLFSTLSYFAYTTLNVNNSDTMII